MISKMKNLIKVSEHIYFMKYRRLGDRPNLYYIKGDKYSIVIDAGNCKAQVDKFYKILKENNLEDPKYTIITHWHWDHTFGLKYAKGETISSIKTYKKLEEVQKWKWNKKDRIQRIKDGLEIPFCDQNIGIEYLNYKGIDVVLPDKYISRNKTFDLGNLKVELIVRDSTHTRDNIFIYVPSDKVLIVADADCPDYYANAIYYQDKLIDMISFFESLDYKYHCLGHALPESKDFALNRLRQEIHINIEDVKKYFDSKAKSWNENRIRNQKIINEILNIADIKEGVSVLDVGCGTGELFLDYKNRKVKSILGVDISEKMLAIANKKYPNIETKCIDALKLKTNKKYDRIVVYNCLPHFDDVDKLIKKLTKLLKTNGRLTIAHSMSRKEVNELHKGKTNLISKMLPEVNQLATTVNKYLEVDKVIDDKNKYLVTAIKNI